jgi:histidine phosphotransferase ChpT
MNPDAATLSALIASRLCHDLVSPISALTTALDVLHDEGSADMREQALKLISTSSQQAAAKLDFMRLAFGAATLGRGDYDLQEMRGTVERFVNAHKPELIWSVAENRGPRVAARILANLVLIGLDCLPRGGTLELSAKHVEGKLELAVIGTGLRAMLKPATRTGLSGQEPEDGFEARNIQPYYLYLITSAAKVEMAARESEGAVSIIARFPPEIVPTLSA